jgi:uncharacterized membrane protein YuzA (DUF378 family)
MKICILDWVAIILVIDGGLNWGLVGAFILTWLQHIFGAMSALSRIVYVLVGIAALYLISHQQNSQKSNFQIHKNTF